MVIKLTLYFKRGQCIELSPQQGAEAWPEPVSWHGYGALAAETMERLLSCSQVFGELGQEEKAERLYRSVRLC